MFDVENIRKAVSRARVPWEAGHTPFTEMSDRERNLRLGYMPGPRDFSLVAAEEFSKRSYSTFMAKAPRAGVRAMQAQYAASLDWRNVSGENYITSVKDQGNCGSCVAFATAATVEGARRVQGHESSLNVDYSEAQLFYCYARDQGRVCEGPNSGWWPASALEVFMNNGIVDEACFPYTAGDQGCHLCINWQGHLTKIAQWQSTNSVDQMKQWLSANGPLVTTYTVYDDFYTYKSGVYRHVTGESRGGHCVCVVGYDDVQQFWICKNSWRTSFGEQGFFRIGYGECGIDATMYTVTGVAP